MPIIAFYGSDKQAYIDAGVIRAVADKIATRGTNFWYDSTAAQILEGVTLPADWPAAAVACHHTVCRARHRTACVHAVGIAGHLGRVDASGTVGRPLTRRAPLAALYLTGYVGYFAGRLAPLPARSPPMLFTLISRLTRNLIVAIPVAMLAGLLYGALAPTGWLKATIIPLTFLMVYPMMVNLQFRKVLEGGDLKVQAAAQLLNFAVIPLIAYALGRVFFADQPFLALGLLLAALLPTSGLTISWTGLSAGNVGAAVKMTVIGLVLGALVTPLYVQVLLGARVQVDLLAVGAQILFVVLLPMAAGYVTRQQLVRRVGQPAYQREWAPRFSPLSTLGVLGIAFVAMALQSRNLLAQPAGLLQMLVPLLLLYVLNFVLSTVVARTLFPRGDALALVYGTVLRNLSIALALAMNAFGAEGAQTALLIALAYIVQTQSAAWYAKFADRLFGPRPAPAPAAGQKN